jgi:hypothetical protein
MIALLFRDELSSLLLDECPDFIDLDAPQLGDFAARRS